MYRMFADFVMKSVGLSTGFLIAGTVAFYYSSQQTEKPIESKER